MNRRDFVMRVLGAAVAVPFVPLPPGERVFVSTPMPKSPYRGWQNYTFCYDNYDPEAATEAMKQAILKHRKIPPAEAHTVVQGRKNPQNPGMIEWWL